MTRVWKESAEKQQSELSRLFHACRWNERRLVAIYMELKKEAILLMLG